MANNNPLTLLCDAIWTTLESKSDFIAIFPHGTNHQIRYSSTASYAPDPDPQELAPADYPLCRVVMSKAKPGTEQDSSNSFLDVTFAIEIRTGQEQQSVLCTATWAIYRAMLMWRTKVRDVVTWNSKACIYDVNAEGIGFTDQDQERNRGTNQWIAVLSTTVRFQFATADLIAN
jgi:hypothetical protein